MAALLGLDYEAAAAVAAEAAQGEVCQAANDNGGGQVVVSGDKAAVERGARDRQGQGRQARHAAAGVGAVPLRADAARRRCDGRRRWPGSPSGAPAVPLVANVLAAPITDPDEIRRRLIEQVTGTVRWRESVACMASQGVTRLFEIGAGKVLSGLVKRIADGAIGIRGHAGRYCRLEPGSWRLTAAQLP